MTEALHVFNFRVEFYQVRESGRETEAALCSGAFSECSGIEATMEPKAVREGGRNFGEWQRVGPVTYSTVILKRGVTRAQDLWTWFELVAGGASSVRLRAALVQTELVPAAEGFEQKEVLRWSMKNALPVKFKAATYNATASEVGVEELHFVHEALSLEVA
jgi:phage tail-like protein